ncbi:MAG: hypothetical protein JO117_07585 [Verrucomicrobia bacterium]|nr:hypothetical protein [Verrucomicrobiota bacterium]
MPNLFSASAAQTDPFADNIFREPRQAPAVSVPGLNDPALATLLAAFQRLTVGSPPRWPAPWLDQALLVVSPQPGYGKSHLLGRLFAALAGRATLVNVTPFQSPSLCWQSVLLRVVQELTFPDSVAASASVALSSAAATRDQLDTLAHSVLAHLVAALIDNGRLPHPQPAEAAAYLRNDPAGALCLGDPTHPWASWLYQAFDSCRGELHDELNRLGLRLHSTGWLRVLWAYAVARDETGEDLRPLCLAWLVGQPLDAADAARLGLKSSEVAPVETPDQINEICWQRLLDFCALAAFYRPFVFCFDQTEAYGHNPDLARCFGTVIAQLHLLAAGQLLVVTANQQPWQTHVAPHLETADKDRFVPLPLEGLTRNGAEALVRLRGARAGLTEAQLAPVLDAAWLASLFPTERNQLGIRQFLQLASRRWRQEQPPAPPPPPVSPTATPPPLPPLPSALVEAFARHRAAVSAKPRRLLYNPDAFRWLVQEIGAHLPGIRVEPFKSSRGHLSLAWFARDEGNKPPIIFGFEPGDNGRRWRTILSDAEASCQQRGARPPIATKALLFRTPEQAPIPSPRWESAAELAAARASFLDLLELTREEVVRLYAARALHLEVLAGDAPAEVTQQTALDFIVAELRALLDRIQRPLPLAAGESSKPVSTAAAR